MKKKATINKILSYCILAILLVIILGTFLVFVRNLFFDSREKQIEKQESITFDSLEMYKKLGKIRTASKDGIPIVVSVYFPFDKNDYEFYEEISVKNESIKSEIATFFYDFTYEELKKITSQAWLSVNDIMKITSTSKRAAYKIKNTIKEDLLKKGYYIPNALLPTREVLEYLKIKEK